MRNSRFTIWVVTAALVIMTGQIFGVTEFKDGATHNIDYTIEDDVLVDYLAPGMQTTVQLLNGGSLNAFDNDGYLKGAYKLQGYNDSRINLSGECEYLYAWDRSRVIISGGQVGYQRNGAFEVYDSSRVTMTGGYVRNLGVWNSSQIIISGGRVSGDFYASDSSQVTMTGGETGEGLFASGNSQVTMTGGDVHYGLVASGNSQVTMTGGYVGVTIGGWVEANGNSRVTISGGKIAGGLRASDTSQITINGSNFAINGISVGFGAIGHPGAGYGLTGEPLPNILTGTLANGDIINNQFQIGEYASIILIPEPASLLLLGLGGLLIRKQPFIQENK